MECLGARGARTCCCISTGDATRVRGSPLRIRGLGLGADLIRGRIRGEKGLMGRSRVEKEELPEEGTELP